MTLQSLVDRRAQGAGPRGAPRLLIRIDSVHQGDLDGIEGLDHINAVAGVQTISEAHLRLVIEQMLA